MTSLYKPKETHKESKNDSDRPLASHSAPHLAHSQFAQHLATTDFQPPAEVREREYSFSVYVDLPGVSARSINITSCTTSVTIQGERRSPQAHSQINSKLVSSDRTTGSFKRVVELSQPILGEQVYAEYSQGVLTLELPKQQCSDAPERMPATCRSIVL